jgi:tellurite resistance protein TerC
MTTAVWVGFLAFILTMIALDLGVLHRRDEVTTVRSALKWTLVWVSLALVFNVVVYFLYETGGLAPGAHALIGREAALQFFTGYLLEYSLSVDNIFVIALIISYFRVPPANQHRLLFWGVLGAIIFRGIMIGIGATLMARFDWIVYVFGVLLIYSAVKMLLAGEEEVHPEKSWLVRLTRRLYPVSSEYDGSRFFTSVAGVHAMTPMFLALILIESSDVMFAIDSIPAIFAVTRDPFLVFTSNIFAILGLRSLYFALAGFLGKFRYLKMSLVFLLAYIGVKMLLSHHEKYKIDNAVSLAIIAGILAVGVLASLMADRNDARRAARQADRAD